MAKRALTAAELSELDELRQRSILIWDFMSQKDDLVRSLAAEAKEAVEVAYRKQDLRAMRIACRDDTEWIGSLKPGDQQLLRQMIVELGHGKPDRVETDAIDNIRRIVARGRIRNGDEYRLISNRVDEIHRDPHAAEELRHLNKLLLEFDSNA